MPSRSFDQRTGLRPMKMNIEIDCTPEEARRFFGLPDVQPMQAKILAEMEGRMVAEMDRLSPDALMKSWMSLAPQGAEQFQDAFTRMFQQGFGGTKSPR